ncbi:MAG: WD repeat-containing protein 18 [Paramarteilia canceri]
MDTSCLVLESDGKLSVRAEDCLKVLYKQQVNSKILGQNTAISSADLEQNLALGFSDKPFILIIQPNQLRYSQKIPITGKLNTIALSPDGVLVAYSSGDHVYVHDVVSQKLLCTLKTHYRPVTCLTFTDDSSYLISGSMDSSVHCIKFHQHLFYDEMNEEKKRHDKVLNSHTNAITAVKAGFGGLNCKIYSSSLDKTIKIWDLRTGILMHSIEHNCQIIGFCIDFSEKTLYFADILGNCTKQFLFSSNEKISSSQKNSHISIKKPISHISLSSNCSKLYVIINETTLSMFDAYNCHLLKTITFSNKIVLTKSFLSRSNYFDSFDNQEVGLEYKEVHTLEDIEMDSDVIIDEEEIDNQFYKCIDIENIET